MCADFCVGLHTFGVRRLSFISVHFVKSQLQRESCWITHLIHRRIEKERETSWKYTLNKTYWQKKETHTKYPQPQKHAKTYKRERGLSDAAVHIHPRTDQTKCRQTHIHTVSGAKWRRRRWWRMNLCEFVRDWDIETKQKSRRPSIFCVCTVPQSVVTIHTFQAIFSIQIQKILILLCYYKNCEHLSHKHTFIVRQTLCICI